MMKHCYLFFIGLFLQLGLLAQSPICQPDTTFRDSVGVFPLPFDTLESPMGGIQEVACLGKPYEFIFTIVIGDTLRVNGIPFILDSLILSTETALEGLPVGLDYACNPPNCVFKNGEIGCLVINGTTASTNRPGKYPLKINGTIVSGFFRLDRTFPDPLIAPGTYDIEVADANADICKTSSTLTVNPPNTNLTMVPNPAAGVGLLKVEVPTTDLYEYRIFNLLGREVLNFPVRLQNGYNELYIDLTQIPNGIYLHSVNNKVFQLSKKLIIQN